MKLKARTYCLGPIAYPHGMATIHAAVINADLLSFIDDERGAEASMEAEAVPWSVA